jgi:3'(2'), 5'-bisphosphate nucleotidase
VTYQKEMDIAAAAVREAAYLCLDVQRQLHDSVLSKLDRSPVTVADFGSQALICSRIRASFPADEIIAEEDASSLRLSENSGLLDKTLNSINVFRPRAGGDEVLEWIDYGGSKEFTQRFWTLDPIDGTKGFLRRNQFAIALALIVDGRVEVSAVGCPNLSLTEYPGEKGLLFLSVRSRGVSVLSLVTMNVLGEAHVSLNGSPSDIRFCESVESAHTSHSMAENVTRAMGIVRPPMRLDSQVKYGVVAAGEAEVYMRLPARRRYVENIWDHAAGSLLVEEAGGMVTDIDGIPLDFGQGYQLTRNRGILASNTLVHDRLLDAIRNEMGRINSGPVPQ